MTAPVEFQSIVLMENPSEKWCSVLQKPVQKALEVRRSKDSKVLPALE